MKNKAVMVSVFAFSLVSLAACTESSSSSGAPPTPTPPEGGTVSATAPDLDAMAKGGDCGAASGPGVDHSGDITSDQTWKASEGVHRVTSNLRVLANVTVEACARVEVGAGLQIQVGGTTPGKLVTRGTNAGSLRPVVFTAADAASPWSSVVVDVNGAADLAYTVLSSGDAANRQQNGGGILRAFGASSASTKAAPTIQRSVRADWLLLEASAGPGANMRDYAGFTEDSTGLAVRSAQGDALVIELGAAPSLPKELVFQGNARDAIVLEEQARGTITTTLVKRSAPYAVDGRIFIQPIEDGDAVTLNVEPGVTVRFGEGRGATGGVYVGASDQRQGQVIARGTAEEPIRFTSAKAAPAAGDWVGFYFRHYPASGTSFENVVIEYAGANSSSVGAGCGPSDNDASMLIVGQRPSDAWVKKSTFRDGGGETGIVLGWTSDESGPDFVGDNTFENMPGCRASRWRTVTAGPCPSGGPTCL